MTKIEWTERTWNPIVGCSVTSPGCTNCYAMGQAHRLASNPATPHYAGTTKMSRGGPVWTGKVAMAPERVLTEPLRRRMTTTYFVNSMGDLFHPDAPDEWIDRVFAVMALCPQHRFQVLTKQAERMRAYLTRLPDRQEGDRAWPANPLEVTANDIFEDMGWDGDPASTRAFEAVQDWPLPNVWLGVSAEDQRRADERIPHLLDTPAAVRFVSCEPLLAPVDLTSCPRDDALLGYAPDENGDRHKIDWVIVGGESGRNARPMHPDWARALRDQCQAAGVPFFFKQWGEWSPIEIEEDEDGDLCAAYPIDGCCSDWDAHRSGECLFWQGDALVHWPLITTTKAIGVRRVGKRAAGRLLDGREWNEVPG